MNSKWRREGSCGRRRRSLRKKRKGKEGRRWKAGGPGLRAENKRKKERRKEGKNWAGPKEGKKK